MAYGVAQQQRVGQAVAARGYDPPGAASAVPVQRVGRGHQDQALADTEAAAARHQPHQRRRTGVSDHRAGAVTEEGEERGALVEAEHDHVEPPPGSDAFGLATHRRQPRRQGGIVPQRAASGGVGEALATRTLRVRPAGHRRFV
ncbi:hypothetical protein JK356_04310 [Streptomyces sp. 7-21]|nr:hypothetical protein [Streptomyces sp. 7-21]